MIKTDMPVLKNFKKNILRLHDDLPSDEKSNTVLVTVYLVLVTVYPPPPHKIEV